ncbi:MAG: DUF4166 domain-containing protein [Pseudomonadota bacterium]
MTKSLYARVLGDRFDALPDAVRDLHDVTVPREWRGRADVRRAGGVLARLVGWSLGLPLAANDVPVHLTFTPFEGGERWERHFGDHVIQSVQRDGRGPYSGLIDEVYGPVRLGLALVLEDDLMRIVPRHWACLGVPMPSFLLPGGDTYERSEGARFFFHVEFVAPVVGWIATYEGWLEAENQ